MSRLVAIGGGDMAGGDTLAIDKAVVSLTGKSHPTALFIPTASSDSREYWKAFQGVYGRVLGCETDVLYLLAVSPTKSELEQKILSADLIYVGGGNTLKMMRRWRKLGVDSILREAYSNGIVLSGLSAGCICWFNWGHSDSMAFYHPERWQYIRVRGMGIVGALCCPHFDSDTAGVKREEDFRQMLQRRTDLGIGIDNHCAIEIVDGTYRVINSRPTAGAYKLFNHSGEVLTKRLDQKNEYESIDLLLLRE